MKKRKTTGVAKTTGIAKTEVRPSTDVTGRFELLLKSRCPFCGSAVYLARPKEGGEALIVMHEVIAPETGGGHSSPTRSGSSGPGPSPTGTCESFNDLLASDPGRFTHEVMTRAGREELEIFIARTSGAGLN